MSVNLHSPPLLFSFLPQQNIEVKDYGSANAYASEVRNWLMTTQNWMMCQQMMFMQNMFNAAQAQAQQVQAQQNLNQPLVRRIIFRRLFNAGHQPQTTITQQYVVHMLNF